MYSFLCSLCDVDLTSSFQELFDRQISRNYSRSFWKPMCSSANSSSSQSRIKGGTQTRLWMMLKERHSNDNELPVKWNCPMLAASVLRGSLNATGTAAVFYLPFSFSRYLYRVLGGVKLTSCAHRQSTVQMEVCVHLRDSRGSGWVRRVSAQQVRCLWRRQIRSLVQSRCVLIRCSIWIWFIKSTLFLKNQAFSRHSECSLH